MWVYIRYAYLILAVKQAQDLKKSKSGKYTDNTYLLDLNLQVTAI